ncbi:hypothetical protein E2562_035149 [Oryza meyeriana var. granulata]|uniref:Neprosin PEP catalytic domain-containing protein n=1 Tax=Oryza meyeriana var. granulata TaxID=110450 RepID=A0A6G1E795_9ORYZ|nr:hypothetical protein E2562_035149 [Oryza meyeriana var. granulata]
MFRLVQLLQATALCVLFLVDAKRTVRLSPSVQEENDSLVRYLLKHDGAPNRKMMSNSIQMKHVVQDINSANVSHFAAHQSTGGPNDNYYGLRATMDVYGHDLKPGQQSGTGLSLSHFGDGKLSSYNDVTVGWHIDPERYGDSHPHLYTSWTRDGYETTGCYNMDCPGFVRANGAAVAPGALIDPVSDGKSLQNVTLELLLDKTSGDWWLYYGLNSVPTAVGCYPKSLFTYLGEKANAIAFGGYVLARRALPTPPMGSGAHPHSSNSRAASFTNLGLIDQDGKSNPIMTDLRANMGNEQCYAVTPIVRAECFYGGPGGCMP